jgi:hypothetical protein
MNYGIFVVKRPMVPSCHEETASLLSLVLLSLPQKEEESVLFPCLSSLKEIRYLSWSLKCQWFKAAYYPCHSCPYLRKKSRPSFLSPTFISMSTGIFIEIFTNSLSEKIF